MNALSRDLEDGERVALKDGTVGTVHGGFGMKADTLGTMIIFSPNGSGSERRDGREIDPEATRQL